MSENNGMITISGLWKRTSKAKGTTYMKGSLRKEDLQQLIGLMSTTDSDRIDLMVFKNEDKKSEKSPDYRIVACEGKSGDKYSKPAVRQEPVKQEAIKPIPVDDQLPF